MKNKIGQPSQPARLVLALGCLGLIAAACSSTSAPTSSATPSTTTSPTGAHGHHGPSMVGVITALPASALDLEVHGKAETVVLLPATTYRQGKTKISETALKTGEQVRVALAQGTSPPTAKAVVVLPATTAYTGIISDLTSTSFVLTLPAGKAHVVTTTSGTTYRNGTATVTAAALKDGETAHVVGRSSSTGTLTATKVTIKATGST